MEPAGLGVTLDTSLLIEGERGGREADALISRLGAVFGESSMALAVVSVVEFTHGIYRAKRPDQRERRFRFAEDIFRVVAVHPVTFSIGMLAGLGCWLAGFTGNRWLGELRWISQTC